MLATNGRGARPVTVNIGCPQLDAPTSVQHPWELGQFIDLLNRERVASYLEVGVCYGGTFETILSAVPSITRAVAVDFPGADGGSPDSAEFLIAACRRMHNKHRSVDYVLGPSTAPEVIVRVARAGRFDAVLIDADHSYAGVKRDFASYSPLGRLVALHDIAREPGTAYLQPIEVRKLWLELKPLYRAEEFIAPGSKMGLGVLYMDRP